MTPPLQEEYGPHQPRVQDLDVGDFVKGLEHNSLHVYLGQNGQNTRISQAIPLPLNDGEKGQFLRDKALELVDEILDIRYKIEYLLGGQSHLKLGRRATENFFDTSREIRKLKERAFRLIHELTIKLGSYSAPHKTVDREYEDALLHFKELTPEEAEEVTRRVTESEEDVISRIRESAEEQGIPLAEACAAVYFHARFQVHSSLNKLSWDLISERPENIRATLEALGLDPDDAEFSLTALDAGEEHGLLAKTD
jgi:hypothetical protein